MSEWNDYVYNSLNFDYRITNTSRLSQPLYLAEVVTLNGEAVFAESFHTRKDAIEWAEAYIDKLYQYQQYEGEGSGMEN